MSAVIAKPVGKIRRRRLSRWLLLVLALVIFAAPRQTDAGLLICLICVCTLVDIPIQVALLDAQDQGIVQVLDFGTAEPIPLGVPGQDSGTGYLGQYQDWLVHSFFAGGLSLGVPGGGIGQAMMAMAEQLTTVMMAQMQAVGMMMDAQDQLKSQLLFQRLMAQAHKDYQPDDDLCMFGTAVRDLAAADFNGGLTTYGLARHQEERELEESATKSATGPASDRSSRLQEFKDRYCDPTTNDYNEGKPTTGLGMVCGTAPTASTIDKDVDYLRTVLLPRTLAIDFTAATASDDQKDVMALSSNLYSSDLFAPLGNGITGGSSNQQTYMDERAVVAKRSVAEESFDALIGMKTQGSADAADNAEPYLGIILQQLGVQNATSNPDIKTFLGKQPSYLAQMEVLSKLIYMRPEFYSNLYDTPANVKRRSVAMQAIDVMMNRDIFDSYMRSEQVLSQLLEIRLGSTQEEVEAAIHKAHTD